MKTKTWYVLEEAESYHLVISFDFIFTNLFSLSFTKPLLSPLHSYSLLFSFVTSVTFYAHCRINQGIISLLACFVSSSSQIYRQRCEVSFVLQTFWQDRCWECFELVNILINGVYSIDFKQFIILFTWCGFHCSPNTWPCSYFTLV